MDNRESLQTNNTRLEANNVSLTSLVNKLKNLPEAKPDPILQDKSIKIIENGTQTITPDEGYDALSSIEITTNASEDLANELNIYNSRLSTQEEKINHVVTLLQEKASGNNGGSSLNIFIQEDEPETKDGVWLQTNKEIVANTEFTIKTSSDTINWLDAINFSYQFYNGAAFLIDKKIYTFGGGVTANRKKANVVDLETGETTALANMPYQFYDGYFGIVGNDIYLLCGNGNNRTAYKYNIPSNSYTQLTSAPFSGVNGCGVAVGTDMYMFATYGTGNLAYKYDTLTGAYTKLTNIPYDAAYCRCAAVGTNIYIFGGSHTNYRRAAYKYDTKNGVYTKLTDIPYDFFNGGCCSNGKYVYLFGSEVNEYKTRSVRYDPVKDSYNEQPVLPYTFWQGVSVGRGSNIYLVGNVSDTTTGSTIKPGVIPTSINKSIEEGVVIIGDTVDAKTTKLISDSLELKCNLVGAYLVENGIIDEETPAFYGDGEKWIELEG